jgi:hypothetical protein
MSEFIKVTAIFVTIAIAYSNFGPAFGFMAALGMLILYQLEKINARNAREDARRREEEHNRECQRKAEAALARYDRLDREGK